MNKFYFDEDAEQFTVKKKQNLVTVKTYKSLIDCMNSYHYYRLQGQGINEALKMAIK